MMTKKDISKIAKKRLAEMWPDSDTFVTEVSVDIPDEQRSKLKVWLNLQHTGKRIFGQDDTELTPELTEAHYRLVRGRRYRMRFKIDKEGSWAFVGFE